jgi:hypothetical protein
MGTGLPQRLCGREFCEAELGVVRGIVSASESCSRAEITRRVCAALGWIDVRGRSKEMGGRVALLRLKRGGWIDLPAPRNGNANGQQLSWSEVEAAQAQVLEGSAEQLGAIEFELVRSKAQSRLWNALIDRYHYLGYSALSGAQLRYVIGCEHGVLGAIGFGAAAWKVAVRDRWIGWDTAQRERNLAQVVNNRRFLIAPWVRVHNLASRILAMATRRVVLDYPREYGIRPVLLETFVDAQRYRGTCYRAANWICLGETTGRGRQDRTHTAKLVRKQVLVYPLVAEVGRALGVGR